MNIKMIREVLNTPNVDDYFKEQALLTILSQDPDVIPNILTILNKERKRNREILNETNAIIGVTTSTLKQKGIKAPKRGISPLWAIEQVKDHYRKWQGFIGPNINLDLDEQTSKQSD
jgi:hypothetical protein